jgi:small subunit ribosomal protein S2
MTISKIEELLQAGAHFGNKTNKWNPKMGKYIHSARKGVHIINLERTVEALEKVLPKITDLVAKGGTILFVGTKNQLKNKVKESAEKVEMPYVSERWFGGMLTNRSTILNQIKKLKTLESRMSTGELNARYSKLEVLKMSQEIDKLNKDFGGIKDMTTLPSAIFVVDTLTNVLAIKEAKSLKIPVIAINDTDTDPSKVDFTIPANDDAVSSVGMILDNVVMAIEEGKMKIKGE